MTITLWQWRKWCEEHPDRNYTDRPIGAYTGSQRAFDARCSALVTPQPKEPTK